MRACRCATREADSLLLTGKHGLEDGEDSASKKAHVDTNAVEPAPAETAKKQETVAKAPTVEVFILSATFTGAKPGYVFTRGKVGVGYYLDKTQPGVAEAEAAKKAAEEAKNSKYKEEVH